MDLDDVLPHVGDWNKYQYLLLWFVCLPICIPCGFTAFNQVFMDRIPDHFCLVPELVSAGWSVQERKEASIPKFGSSYSHCQLYDLNYTALAAAGVSAGLKVSNQTAIIPCQNGWEYELDQVPSSIVIDFDLVCSKSLYPTLGLSALNVGGLVGVLLFGFLNDRWGRKKSFFLCLTIMIVFGVLTAFAPNMFWWSVCRFFVGMTVPAILHIPFVICLEVVSPSKRTLISFYANMFYVVGLMGFTGLAYVVNQWAMLSLACSVPFVFYYLFALIQCESMRWLLSQGRIDEVIQMLNKVAAINDKQVPGDIIQKFKETMETQWDAAKVTKEEKGRKPNIKDLFLTKNMRLKTLIICFSWVVNETVYVGLSYYGPSMGTDPYFSFFLSSIVEVPGYILCLLLMDKLGRRSTLCGMMIVSGLASISTAILPADAGISALILFLIAKSTIAGGTLIIFQYGGELFPTEIRGIGIGLASFLGGIGLSIIPFINYLGTQWLALPIVIMGAFSVVGGVVTLKLPETLGAKLPQTLEEGEQFGKDFNGWNDTVQHLSRWMPTDWKRHSSECPSDINLQHSRDSLRTISSPP